MIWVTIAAVLAAGVTAGFFIGRYSGETARENERLDEDLRQVREELAAYRRQVSEHFSQSAELINTMTENYRAVYRHLAEGEQRLCGGASLRPVALGYQEGTAALEQAESPEEGDGASAVAAGPEDALVEEPAVEPAAEPTGREQRVH